MPEAAFSHRPAAPACRAIARYSRRVFDALLLPRVRSVSAGVRIEGVDRARLPRGSWLVAAGVRGAGTGIRLTSVGAHPAR